MAFVRSAMTQARKEKMRKMKTLRLTKRSSCDKQGTKRKNVLIKAVSHHHPGLGRRAARGGTGFIKKANDRKRGRMNCKGNDQKWGARSGESVSP